MSWHIALLEGRNKERNEGKVEELCMILLNQKKEGREEGKKREGRRGGAGGGEREEKRKGEGQARRLS